MIELLERGLSDPEGPFAQAKLAELDRTETLPREACRLLYDLGLHLICAPARHGGDMSGFLELIQTIRLVARRDLSVAVAHGQILLGSAPIWVAGDDAQARALTAEIAAGAVISFGLTEREHGSDVLKNEAYAVETENGWLLTGQKWPINYATHGDLICVFARTHPSGGPRSFSLFLVDKRKLRPDQRRFLPKTPTHGLRGADISGIAFDGAEIPADAMVGQRGDGVAIALKSLQLTRTCCAGLSLGAADHALRLALDAGGDMAEGGMARSVAGMLVAEAVAAVGARSFQTNIEEMTVVSAVVKSFVPGVATEVIAQAGEVLGSAAFRDANGEYAKVERDHRIVEIFDGSTYVNRNALINHFPLLARGWKRGLGEVNADLAAELPEFDARKLSLVAKTGCSVVQTLPAAVDELRSRGRAELVSLAESLLHSAQTLHKELEEWRPVQRGVPAAAFDLAERYERCFAGAACLHLYLANPIPDHWLEAALTYVLTGEACCSSPPRGLLEIDPTGWGL